MTDSEVIPVFVRMICSFLAAFPAVALWSRTRDAAWMMVVLGALFLFVDALFSVLTMVGLVSYSLSFDGGRPLLQSVLAGLPGLFFSIGCLIFLAKNRRY